MAKQNTVFLYGFIEKKPTISIDKETNEVKTSMTYLHVVRGVRDAHDGKKYMKHDHPLIVGVEKHIVERLKQLEVNDTVYIKGSISTKWMDKKTFCPYCKDEHGNATVNTSKGLLLYITPIHVNKMKSFDTKDEALEEIIRSREMSNQAIIVGTLVNDPSYFKTKNGLIVSQYQLITDRKFRVRTDDPDIRTDWPWVKSYGEQAIEDRMRLTKGSNVIIDGFIQARTVNRKTKCQCCGRIYEWQDQTMEIVPFDTEYVRNTYKTDEMLEAESGQKAEEIRQALFGHLVKDELTEDMNTDDLAEDQGNEDSV